MFEDDYLRGQNSRELPALFYEIAEPMGAAPQDVRDAVLAAWEASPESADGAHATAMAKKFLLPLVEPYATQNNLDPDKVCEALLTCALTNAAMAKLREELTRKQRTT